jgi:hypothetical protein
MKVTEIITNPPRDEYIDGYQHVLVNAPTVATIKNLELKKDATPLEVRYGLFNKDDIVGFMSLEYRGDDIWEVTLVQLAQAYKGMGYGTFLYDYAVMNDKLKVMSDATNTGGKHGSRDLWLRLKSNNRYKVVGYDTKTKEVIPGAADTDIYDNKPNTRWLAIPPNTTINESLEMIQSTMKKRYVVWYGPGTTTAEYFNY